jgi:hypothetical protein
MAALNSIDDDSCWPEVKSINNYAVVIGYMQMAVRGCGLMMLSWTTAVLLGGFIGNLGDDDFFCLTIIMVVQTARLVSLFRARSLPPE